MSTKNIRELLYQKAENEQKAYYDDLKQMTPEQIIERCYETVMREDIFLTFEYERIEPYFTDKQVEKLLDMKYPVANCYDEWQKSDVTYMDRIQESIDTYTKELVKESEEKQKDKKKHEPER